MAKRQRTAQAEPQAEASVTTQALAPVTPGHLVPAPETATIVGQLIQLASDPAVNVEKINALIDANERVMAIAAKQQFDAAFAEMQSELPVIRKGGVVQVVKDGRIVRETPYARDVDIAEAVRPVLARHGFSLRHQNSIENGHLTVTGILAHRAGHREQDTFGPIKSDNSGAKNEIQAWGSARTYGKRYTTISLLGIASEVDEDDDGAASGPVQSEPKPKAHARPKATPSNTKCISNAQRKRLFTILTNSGRTELELRGWIKDWFGIESTRDIELRDYDYICTSIEAPGALPSLPSREPGEEG